MLADSHCHLDRLDLTLFGGDLAGVLDAAAANDVTRLLSVATDLESWPALARITPACSFMTWARGCSAT